MKVKMRHDCMTKRLEFDFGVFCYMHIVLHCGNVHSLNTPFLPVVKDEEAFPYS